MLAHTEKNIFVYSSIKLTPKYTPTEIYQPMDNSQLSFIATSIQQN